MGKSLPHSNAGRLLVDLIKLKPKHEAGFTLSVANGKLLSNGRVSLCGEEEALCRKY